VVIIRGNIDMEIEDVPIRLQMEMLINFFTWLNDLEGLEHTKEGITFYVEEYINSNYG
jgi:hypothetical protein